MLHGIILTVFVVLLLAGFFRMSWERDELQRKLDEEREGYRRVLMGVHDHRKKAMHAAREQCAQLADELAMNAAFEGHAYRYVAEQIRRLNHPLTEAEQDLSVSVSIEGADKAEQGLSEMQATFARLLARHDRIAAEIASDVAKDPTLAEPHYPCARCLKLKPASKLKHLLMPVGGFVMDFNFKGGLVCEFCQIDLDPALPPSDFSKHMHEGFDMHTKMR